MEGKPLNKSHFDLLNIGINTHDQIDAYIAASESKVVTAQVRNQTGATLTKGTVVYISGASGNKPLVLKAQANSEVTSSKTFGIIKADIPHNQNGEAVFVGSLAGLDTLAYPEGTALWLSPSVAGGYTSTKPVAPNHAVFLGVVTRQHQNQGAIEVRIVNGYELEELHNVLINNPQNGQVIAYDSADQLYKNTTLDIGDISNLQTSLDGKQPLSSILTNTTASFTAGLETKLNGIASGATANSTDAQLRDRSTHTGTQLSSTISDFADTVRGTLLTGLSLLTGGVIAATDSILVALGKLQNQITGLSTSKQDTLVSGTNIKTLEGQSLLGAGNIDLSKSDVGLGNVDNTSDVNKPISSATQTALDAKQPLATVLTNTTASFTTAQETKLAGIQAGAEVNVNADWNAVSGDAQILNKPSIPTQYTDELAQDAVGNILTDSTSIDLIYDDSGNTISAQREALTGAITASKNSNTTSLGSFTLSELNTALSDADVATGGGTATGTNTGDQNTFSTIVVAGQSNVVADSTTDSLTLVAGSNITITTNPTNDSVTISSTGGGGITNSQSIINALIFG